MIQTAGTRSKRRSSVKGPKAPDGALFLSAKHLPNPYSHVRAATTSKERLTQAREYLMRVCPEKVERLVEAGCRAIEQGKPVVVICLHGRDRSKVVAQMIGERFHWTRVYYVHREYP